VPAVRLARPVVAEDGRLDSACGIACGVDPPLARLAGPARALETGLGLDGALEARDDLVRERRVATHGRDPHRATRANMDVQGASGSGAEPRALAAALNSHSFSQCSARGR
jgi:hypothetical protein